MKPTRADCRWDVTASQQAARLQPQSRWKIGDTYIHFLGRKSNHSYKDGSQQHGTKTNLGNHFQVDDNDNDDDKEGKEGSGDSQK